MANNKPGFIDLFGPIRAKTEDGIVVYPESVAVEVDENGKPIKNLAQAIADGSLGGGNSTDKPTNRPVPNTGTLDKVYFNTSLNVEEVVKIINQLEFHTYQNQTIYTLFIAGNKAIHIFKTAENTYTIMSITFELYWTNVPEMDVPVGWQSFENPINCENNTLESENDGIPRGEQNDKISQLISIDPFINSSPLEVIDVEELPSPTIELEGTAVPSSGMVSKVYFNTKLSVEEVKAILDSLEYVEGVLSLPAVAVATTTDMSIGVVVMGEGQGSNYNVITGVVNGEEKHIFTYVNGSTDNGWHLSELELNIDNMLEAIASQVDMVIQNSALKNLISITPFEEPNTDIQLDKLYRTPIKEGGEWSGTAVPSSGQVDKLYFNTKLSVEEVNAILDTLEYTTNTNLLPFPFVAVTMDSTMQNGLMCTKYSNDGGVTYSYLIIDVINGNFGNGVYEWDISYNEGLKGWINSEANFNIDNMLSVLAPQVGMTIQNDKLSKLISTTPFTKINEEILGYKYNQFVNGEWKELGSDEKIETTVIIKKPFSLNLGEVDITDEDWNTLTTNLSVIVVFSGAGYTFEMKRFLYDEENKKISLHGFAPVEMIIHITKTDDGYEKEMSFMQRVDRISALTVVPDTNMLELQYEWDGGYTVVGTPVDTETATDSDKLITSKAVRNYIAEYMTANYDNFDEEEF